MSSQIRRGAVLSYAAVAFNAVAGLLYTPWMVNTIGSDDYGLYTLAMSVINIFVMDFGLGEAVSRFLSKYYAEGNERAVNEFVGMIVRFYLILAAILFCVLLAVFLNVDTIYANLSDSQMVTFKRLFVIVGLYSVVSFPFTCLNGILIANELFVKLNGCDLLQRVLTVGLIIVALIMGVGVYGLVLVNAGVGLFFNIIKLIIVKHDTDVVPRFETDGSISVREVVGFSAWTMVVQLSQRLIFTLMPSIIAIVSTSAEIAVFGLAASLEGYVWTVANALNGMFMPKVTGVLHGEDSEEPMQRLAVRVGRVQLLVTGAIIVGFVSIGRDFVTCWVGPRYESLYLCTLLLIAPELVELPTMIEGTAIVAAGRVREKSIVYMIMAATNLVLGFVLTGPLGAIGSCLAICVAYVTRTSGMCMLYARYLSFDIVRFLRDTYAGWILSAAITIAIGRLVSNALPMSGWLGLGIEAFTVAAAYCLACWLLFLLPSERAEVKGLLHMGGTSGANGASG